MAESTLSLKYADFQREVAFLLGWQRDPNDWDNTQKNDFQDISERAQRQFYFPPSGEPEQPVYEWSFLRKTGSIAMNTNTSSYDLPDDFATILEKSTSWPSGTKQRQLKKIPEQDIRQLQAMDPQNGWPKYYGIRLKTPDFVDGHRWEMLVYPTPQADQNNTSLSFSYVFVPDTIGNTNIYPVGGARYSELMLSSYLAAAEFKQDDDPEGPFNSKFKTELAAAIRADKQFKQNERGGEA